MLFKIAKTNIIFILIMLLCGCGKCDINQNSSVNTQINLEETSQINCGYKYTYTCGYNIIAGKTECNYGYFYTCS